VQDNEKDKKELGKTAEDELMVLLEHWINKWDRNFEVTFALGFMVMERNTFDLLGGKMVIYPENYENGKIHFNALQNYCETLREPTQLLKQPDTL
jgi:hypothetical protein